MSIYFMPLGMQRISTVWAPVEASYSYQSLLVSSNMPLCSKSPNSARGSNHKFLPPSPVEISISSLHALLKKPIDEVNVAENTRHKTI